jgi:hypothetical protein
MSKEQTPMEKQLKDWSPLKFNGEMKWRNEDVIKFAQAKVLEALEREVPKAYLSWYEGVDDLAGDKYYETEVKTKYKL